ncbi:MAG: hypothetical protein UHN47_13955 [Lachnospiraceae bacterium]|nr:hypothetical protein [Lachnospiraceae bacterium]
MKKYIIKIAVCILVFLCTLFISSSLYNQGNEDMTTTMEQASLPIVHITNGNISFNTLYGYRQDMDGRLLRDTITPLETGRSLSFSIEKYENEIKSLSFEIRSIDGTRLVESTQITNYVEQTNTIKATVNIKDLIEKGLEYNWILKVETPTEMIRYYTRIIDADEFHTKEKLAFVKDFHGKTFDKEEAKELVSYLESNSKGDNTTFSKVDIHCSLNQVTWGNLQITKLTEPDCIIQEIDNQTASIRMRYIVQSVKGKNEYRYNISEYYRIRYTNDRVYLLDFDRTMNQIFDTNADVYASNKIMLGIRDAKVQMMESDGGSNLAFVNEDQLFCYHAADKKMAYLFSFYDDIDIRTYHDQHDIKILSVDETGNVTFMVYGYMNRGRHEGKAGIQIYEYNGMLNTIEERIFIPCNKAFAALKADVEQLSYINKNGTVYLYLDGSILAVHTSEQSYSEVASGLQEGNFQVSASDEMLVWQNADNAYDCTKLILMNLNTGFRKEVSVDGNKRLMPLGFIGEDLIYGVAHYTDIREDFTGSITFPMYAVYIQNEEGEILKNYEQPGVYVVGSVVTDNLITLKRVEKDQSGDGYQEIVDDQIVNNIIEESGHNSSEIVATQDYEKIVQIVLKATIEAKKLKFTEPKEVIFEGTRDLEILVQNPVERFYVYGKDGIMGTFTHPSDAINLAYEHVGTVVNEDGKYIWKKSGRTTRNQIMAIKGSSMEEDVSALAVCLETILSYEGISRDVQNMLNHRMTAIEILEESLLDTQILELSGVTLDAVLYYVNQDIPVLVTLEDADAMLVIGFNELNIVVMNPNNGKIYKMGMKDATQMFESHGNLFVTYLK